GRDRAGEQGPAGTGPVVAPIVVARRHVAGGAAAAPPPWSSGVVSRSEVLVATTTPALLHPVHEPGAELRIVTHAGGPVVRVIVVVVRCVVVTGGVVLRRDGLPRLQSDHGAH